MEAWSTEHVGKMLINYGRTEDHFTLENGNGPQFINMTHPPHFVEDTYVTAYNVSYPYTFSFEQEFEVYKYVNLVGTTKWMAKWFMVLYLGGIYLLKQYMKTREAFVLQRALVLWNLSLATLSILGAIRTVTEVYQLINNLGLVFSFCFAG